MKNIAFLIYDTSLMGGAEKVSINLANSLGETYNVTIISLFQEKGEPFFEISENCKHTVISRKLQSITKNIFSLKNNVKKILKENNIDILFSVTPGIVSVGVLATLGTKVSHVFCEHSNLENQTYGKKHLLRQYIGAKFSNEIVVLTQRDKKNYINKFKIKEEKIKVIANSFNATELNEDYNINSKIIVSLGRLKTVKGYDRLIQVAKKVFEKNKDWQWYIYGDGDEENNIRRDIKVNNLEDFVKLKGVTKNPLEVMKDASFLVMTSYYEGIPLTLLEAQAARLPLVSFDCPTGPGEIIKDNENGYLIDNGNIGQMADKINDLITDEEKRVYFSNNSQKYLCEFSEESILKKWVEIIEKY